MDVREEILYDAPPDDVFEMLCDQAFREKVSEAIGAVEYDVSVSRDGDTAHVRNRRVLDADVPDVARKLVGDRIELVQKEEWHAREPDGARTAAFRVEIPGKPGAITGTVTLSPTREGTREVVAGQVKVPIPLIGRKLEGLVGHGFTGAMEAEGRVGTAWLAGER